MKYTIFGTLFMVFYTFGNVRESCKRWLYKEFDFFEMRTSNPLNSAKGLSSYYIVSNKKNGNISLSLIQKPKQIPNVNTKFELAGNGNYYKKKYYGRDRIRAYENYTFIVAANNEIAKYKVAYNNKSNKNYLRWCEKFTKIDDNRIKAELTYFNDTAYDIVFEKNGNLVLHNTDAILDGSKTSKTNLEYYFKENKIEIINNSKYQSWEIDYPNENMNNWIFQEIIAGNSPWPYAWNFLPAAN